MSTTTPRPGPGNRDVEYEQAIEYIHHMYDTRHQIFQFAIGLNTVLLAAVFQFLTTDLARLAMSLLGGCATLAIALMARRAHTYTGVLETYCKELETQLGFGLVGYTSSRMPVGWDSTVYLFLVYWLFIAAWIVLFAFYGLRYAGLAFVQL